MRLSRNPAFPEGSRSRDDAVASVAAEGRLCTQGVPGRRLFMIEFCRVLLGTLSPARTWLENARELHDLVLLFKRPSQVWNDVVRHIVETDGQPMMMPALAWAPLVTHRDTPSTTSVSMVSPSDCSTRSNGSGWSSSASSGPPSPRLRPPPTSDGLDAARGAPPRVTRPDLGYGPLAQRAPTPERAGPFPPTPRPSFAAKLQQGMVAVQMPGEAPPPPSRPLLPSHPLSGALSKRHHVHPVSRTRSSRSATAPTPGNTFLVLYDATSSSSGRPSSAGSSLSASSSAASLFASSLPATPPAATYARTAAAAAERATVAERDMPSLAPGTQGGVKTAGVSSNKAVEKVPSASCGGAFDRTHFTYARQPATRNYTAKDITRAIRDDLIKPRFEGEHLNATHFKDSEVCRHFAGLSYAAAGLAMQLVPRRAGMVYHSGHKMEALLQSQLNIVIKNHCNMA
ncbi:MAG: hypothetical protein WDW36_005698 [Sanguina aurantia]